MGLAQPEQKIPANASLSYTLSHLRTVVTVESAAIEQIKVPIGHTRFVNFVNILKENFGVTENLAIESNNNFPAACGIASSAASFAAITAAIASYAQQPLNSQVIAFSRFGSGSACRSFYQGFVKWEQKDITPIELPYSELAHAVLLLDKTPKKTSSSTAHKLVQSSPLYKARLENVNHRLPALVTAISNKDWALSGEIITEEYLEMHALFTSAKPSFNYRSELCIQVESFCQSYNNIFGHKPWITLDAGPNIHLLFANQDAKSNFFNEFQQEFPNIEVFA